MLKQTGRPSPALIVSLIALFVALGGTVYAASGRIDGAAIKVKSIPGNRLKSNSVTGKQVKESSLGLVRRARSAVGRNLHLLAGCRQRGKIWIGTIELPQRDPDLPQCRWENTPRPAATVAAASKRAGTPAGRCRGLRAGPLLEPFTLTAAPTSGPMRSTP